MKKSVLDFRQMKKKGEKIAFLTCYDYPTAHRCEKAGFDMLLVGDSAGMVVYGYTGTLPVTMEQMIAHTQAVKRGAPNTFIIGDMPFLSYQESVQGAIHNAGRFHKEAEVDAIKLEGGKRVTKQIEGIVDAGMLVMGHIGLTPQSTGQLGGFKAQGRTAESAIALIEDALAVEKAGAFAILLEAAPPEVGKIISERCQIPVLGIGAGVDVDGQLLIVSDMLGIFEAFTPKFVKKYANISGIIESAFNDYMGEVKAEKFPQEEHCYRMLKGELEKLEALIEGADAGG